MVESAALDEARVTAFEERLVGALNEGALCLMTSVGHRTGLFDAMAKMPPGTSAQIAAGAGLNERYVREWLGAMVAADVIEIDPEAGTYRLPPEHAARLTRAATPANLALVAQYIPLLGSVEDDIVACFRDGGGVPYACYGRFHEVMAEDSGQTILPMLREHILPLVPDLLDRLEAGIRVVDVGCGRGRALNLMAGWFPKSRFVGYDLSQEAIAFATEEAAHEGHANAPSRRAISAGSTRRRSLVPSTSRPASTRCTTRPDRWRCCAASVARWQRAGSTSPRTSRARATTTSTRGTRSVPCSTPPPACIA
jgi:hypothetical protein